MTPILMLDGLLRAQPIVGLLLDDLRRAAHYLDALAAAPDTETDHAARARAHTHAVRLWAAAQAIERLGLEIGDVIVEEQMRRVAES